MPNPNKLYELLRKLSILVALSLFVFSVISPFYHATFPRLTWANYWSYKAEHSYVMGILPPLQLWFSDYWFMHPSYIDGPVASLIPLPMFIIQGLTLAYGFASIVINRKIIASAPIYLSLTVLALMSYVGYTQSSARFNSMWGGGRYQLGYYLVFPSVALFTFAFVLSEVTGKSPIPPVLQGLGTL